MTVLVDTSVWVHFLANRAPFAGRLDALLTSEDVAGHPFVYGELLLGDSGGRRPWLEDYLQLPAAPVVPHSEVVAFVRSRRLDGRGIGWIDTHLLASALVGKTALWTADRRLASVAREVGVEYV